MQVLGVQVDYMVLADAAATSEGKHYIHGAGWDRISATSFPASHPMMAVAIRLRIPWTATNEQHPVELDLIDADGVSILEGTAGPLQGEINVGRPPQINPGDDQVVCLVFNLIGLTFPQPGTYSAVLGIDGNEAARQPFFVVEVGA